jgi:hypothetical protein
VEINWATASELYNDYFTIQKSSDGLDYNDLTIVKGAGNSNNILNYSTIDNNVVSDITYYRLSQTDYDGKTTVYPAKSVSCSDNSGYINVYVSNDAIVADIYTLSQESYQIRVFDATGKQLMSTNYSLNKGYNHLQIDSKNWAKGLYIVDIQDKDIHISKKVLKQ